MKKLLVIVICLFGYLQSQAQEIKQKKTNQLKSTAQKSEANSQKKIAFLICPIFREAYTRAIQVKIIAKQFFRE